jgi:hypothetical protein
MIEPKINEWLFVEITNACNDGEHIPALICYQGKNNYHYGFSYAGIWTDTFGTKRGTGLVNPFRIASPSEVLEALTKEAVKRGLVAGVKIPKDTESPAHCVIGNDRHFIQDRYVKYFFNTNELWAYAEPTNVKILDSSGTWATPIPKDKTTEYYCNEFYETHVMTIPQRNQLIDFFKQNNLKITPDV